MGTGITRSCPAREIIIVDTISKAEEIIRRSRRTPSEMKASESEWLGVPKHRASGIRLCGCGLTVFDLADGKSVLRAALLDRRECGLKATTQGLLGGSVRNTVRQAMN